MGSASNCRLAVLGAFGVHVGGRNAGASLTPKVRAVLVDLVMHPEGIARDRLIEDLWPDVDPERGRDNLKSALSTLRRALREIGADPDAYLAAGKGVVRWIAPTATDLALLDSPDELSHPQLLETMQRCAGSFLDGDYGNWAVVHREHFNERYERVLARLVHEARCVDAAKALLARDPYNEAAYETIVADDEHAGRHAAAARTVERAAAAFAELGTPLPLQLKERRNSLAARTENDREPFKPAFAGRLSELERVKRAICTPSSTTLLIGEAGIGKSTLLDRALRTISHDTCLVSSIEDDPRPFGAFGAAFERASGSSIDAVATAANGDAELLAQEFIQVLPPSAALIVDDAQWLTGSARDLFIATVRAARFASHAVLISSRSEAAWLHDAVDMPFDEIELDTLAVSDVDVMLERFDARMRTAFAQALHKRTNGHPRFLVDYLAAMSENGTLHWESGVWKVSSPEDATGAIPKTVRRTIEKRLRSCGPTASTIACALALEPDATPAQLTRVTACTDTELFDAIDALLDAKLIEERGAHLSFTHDLVREVARTILNAARRAKIHAGLASLLQGDTMPNAALRRARHLEALAQPCEAARSYLAATENSLNAHAYDDARTYARRALDFAEQLEDLPETNLLLAHIHLTRTKIEERAGAYAAAIKTATDAMRFADRANEPDLATEALMHRAALHGNIFDSQARLDDANNACARLELSKNAPLRLNAAYLRAEALRANGENEEAEREFHSIRDEAARQFNWMGVAGCELRIAAIHRASLDLATALHHNELAIDAYRRGNELLGETSGKRDYAFLWYLANRNDVALREIGEAERALREFRKERFNENGAYGGRHEEFLLQFLRALVLNATNDREEALRILDGMEACDIAHICNARDALRVDLLLQHNRREDDERARAMCASLQAVTKPAGYIGASLTPEGCRARIAARFSHADARERIQSAIDATEQCAILAPLDADREFSRLADAAAECNADDLFIRASALAREYGDRRNAAARLSS